MGLLRMYLAVAVLLWHHLSIPDDVRNLFCPFSFIIVCIFFIISGFYIAMILNESYNRPYGTYDFYLNRVLRIYPVYFVVLAAMVIVINLGIIHPNPLVAFSLPPNSPLDFRSVMEPGERFGRIIKDVAIFPYAFFRPNISSPYFFPTLGQMLTVAMELLFYATAPFLVKRPLPVILGAFVVSVGMHFAPLIMRLPARPWQYEVFPCILIFFLAGALSYRLYKVIRSWTFSPRWGWLTLGLLFAYFFIFRKELIRYQWTNSAATLGLYALVTLTIPFLFHASKNSKVDRFLGDISYPFYVINFPMIWVFGNYPHNEWLVPGMTLAVSVALVYLIERPMGRFRHSLSVGKLISDRSRDILKSQERASTFSDAQRSGKGN